MSQQCTALWSLELYALGMPLMWALWVLLLYWENYYGQSGRCGWSPVQLVARLCLVQRLLGTGGRGVWSQGGWLHSLRCPEASVGPLVNEDGSQGGWIRDPRCIRPNVALLVGGLSPDMAGCGGPGPSVHSLVGRARAQGNPELMLSNWCLRLGPGANASPTGGWSQVLGPWATGLRDPRSGINPLLGRT